MARHAQAHRIDMRIRRIAGCKYRPILEPLEPRLALTSLPEGFVDQLVVDGLQSPTAMAFAPDGRLFVCEQGGSLRIIRDGVLLPEPFTDIDVNTVGERGLLGVTFHPDFMSGSPFVYVNYTVPTAPIHQRISYFEAEGDVAAPGSETIVLDLDDGSGNYSLNGGAIHFGEDDKLYIGTGQAQLAENSQALDTLHGKILRVNPDGSIPPDNPFVVSPNARHEIWARGFRNPYTFAVQPGSGRIYVNDVGSNNNRRREEINDLIPRGNYGWPLVEGYTNNARTVSPEFAYGFKFGDANCAISGGTFYNPPSPKFPTEYVGKYFFSDFCGGWIYQMDPDAPSPAATVARFALDISPKYVVDLQVSPTGSLYYVGRENGGFVSRIDYVGRSTPAPRPTPFPVDSDSLPQHRRDQVRIVKNSAHPAELFSAEIHYIPTTSRKGLAWMRTAAAGMECVSEDPLLDLFACYGLLATQERNSFRISFVAQK